MGGSMDTAHEQPCAISTHPPRILMLYGSLRERDLAPVFPDPSYSQLSARSVMDSERTCAA